MAMFHVKQNKDDAVAVYNIVCIFVRARNQPAFNGQNYSEIGILS